MAYQRDASEILGIAFVIALITTGAIVILTWSSVAAWKNIKTPPLKPKPSELQQSIDACVDKGGVPIVGQDKIEGYSPHDVLKDCKMVVNNGTN